MSSYQIVASDLDGTLLNSAGRVSEENQRAIKKMTERGVQFVPCTGRTLMEMNSVIREDPSIRYIIHSDGAVVYDKLTGERIAACMSQGEVGHLLDILQSYPTIITVRYQSNVYMDHAMQGDAVNDRFHIDPYVRDEVMTRATRVERFDGFCRSIPEAEMISAFFINREQRDDCIRRLREEPDYAFISWVGLDYCEVFSKRAGKGNALMALAKHLGCDRSDTIGVGDSTNDMTLIRSAGLGLAVSNACDVLKEEADATICSNDEHAIQFIFENYVK